MRQAFKTLYQLSLVLTGRSRFYFVLSVLLFLAVTGIRTLAPVVFAWIVATSQDLAEGVGWGVLTYAGIFFSVRVIEELRLALYVCFEQEMQRFLALKTIDIFFQMPHRLNRAKSPSENAIIVDRGLQGMRGVMMHAVFTLAPVLAQAVILLVIIAFTVDWMLASLTAATLITFLWATCKISEETRRLQEEWFAIATNNYKILSETLNAYETIRSFDQTKWAHDRYSASMVDFIKKVISSLRPGILLGFVQGVLMAILMGATTGMVLMRSEPVAAKIAMLVLVNGLVLQLATPLLQFSGAYRGFISGLASAKQLLEMISIKRVPAKIEHIPYSQGSEFYLTDVKVDIDGKSILDIDVLDIPAGKLVAINGASGSGKSTLARCLAGLSEYQGFIHSRWPSKAIFYMTQNVHVFDIDIDQNIALGLPIDEARMLSVLVKAGISHAEYDTLKDRGIGEGGMNVSGGQRQRIGIARMLYHNAEVLIFDEPTSALDGDAAAQVMETLKELSKEKTCIVVSHDQRCVNAANVVLTMANGSCMDALPS